MHNSVTKCVDERDEMCQDEGMETTTTAPVTSNLSEGSVLVLKAVVRNAMEVTLGDFGDSTEVASYVTSMSVNQVNGHLADLVAKGIIGIDNEYDQTYPVQCDHFEQWAEWANA